jgi:spermidine synthase
MHIRPNRRDRKFAGEIFRRYKAKDGSAHIASAVSLAHLSACLREFRPRRVLECGAGIGTITDALLSHESHVERVVSFEWNAFCLRTLASNLAHHDRSRLAIVTDASELPATPADMIVCDGDFGDVFRAARPGTVIFSDGTRQEFREQCRCALERGGLTVLFGQHGAGRSLKFRYWSRFGIPIFRVAPKRKGCWIGQVSATKRVESLSG